MPGISINSPTVACVVSVTWALVRFGLLAVRLRADFVVTEAMVVGRTSRGARHGQPLGSLCSSYRRRAGGQRSRGSRGAVAGRSQATLGRVAGEGRPGVGTALGLPSLLVCYMPLAPRRGSFALVDA